MLIKRLHVFKSVIIKEPQKQEDGSDRMAESLAGRQDSVGSVFLHNKQTISYRMWRGG